MSKLKSKPSIKQKQNLDVSISGVENQLSNEDMKNILVVLPWEEVGVRADVTKVYNLRLSEPYFLKLKYIAKHTPNSMQKFCLKVMQEAIDVEIKRITV